MDFMGIGGGIAAIAGTEEDDTNEDDAGVLRNVVHRDFAPSRAIVSPTNGLSSSAISSSAITCQAGRGCAEQQRNTE